MWGRRCVEGANHCRVRETQNSADVNKGTETSIKGVTEHGLAVVSFSKIIGKTEHRADYAIKLSNIILASEKK